MLGMGCHQRVCPSGILWRYFLIRPSWLEIWISLFWNMLWLSRLLCLSACCSRIVTLCLGACIFRHVRLRVMTFTGYLWKCHSGHDTGFVHCVLYQRVCSSGSDVGRGRRWNLTSDDSWHQTGCFVCLSPQEPALLELLTLTGQGAAGNLLQGPDCTVTSVATSGTVSDKVMGRKHGGNAEAICTLTACPLSPKSVFH